MVALAANGAYVLGYLFSFCKLRPCISTGVEEQQDARKPELTLRFRRLAIVPAVVLV